MIMRFYTSDPDLPDANSKTDTLGARNPRLFGYEVRREGGREGGWVGKLVIGVFLMPTVRLIRWARNPRLFGYEVRREGGREGGIALSKVKAIQQTEIFKID